MGRRLTQKQETFCLKYFELGNASEAARLANYSPKTSGVIGAENLLKPKIIERIEELRKKAEDATIATVLERKQVLTEIVRGRFADFMTKLTPERLRSAALQEIRITEIGKDVPIKRTTIRLHNPVQAIAELNKMEGIYEAEGNISVNNQILNINVLSEKAKNLTQSLIEGNRAGVDAGGDNSDQNL